MIGAMPAIAVRGKNKADGSIGFMSRPHKLSLHFRPPALTNHQVTPSPSPVNSPGAYRPPRERTQHRLARKFLSKRFIFQLSVLAPLVGAILLFIGLVQLTPEAEEAAYGIPLIVAGSAALILGLILILLRAYFSWTLNRLQSRRELPQIKVNEASVTDPDVEKIVGGGGERKSVASASPSPTNLQPSPKAPPRNRSKDRDKKLESESVKLLETSGGPGSAETKKDDIEKCLK